MFLKLTQTNPQLKTCKDKELFPTGCEQKLDELLGTFGIVFITIFVIIIIIQILSIVAACIAKTNDESV